MNAAERAELEKLRDQMDKIIASYKTPGCPETYGAYQEGRADCADVVCTALESLLARHSEREAAESSECVACERPVCHRQDCGRFDGAGGALCADCYDDLESESR